jgi:hypothetical protein
MQDEQVDRRAFLKAVGAMSMSSIVEQVAAASPLPASTGNHSIRLPSSGWITITSWQ